MALSDIIIPTKTVAYRGATFTVHGVTANDVMRMLTEAEKDMERAVELVERLKDDENVQEAIMLLLREVPELVARLIATAADEPQAWETVARLPISTQAEALAAVWDLTFEEPDSVKRFAANLAGIVETMTPLARRQAA